MGQAGLCVQPPPPVLWELTHRGGLSLAWILCRELVVPRQREGPEPGLLGGMHPGFAAEGDAGWGGLQEGISARGTVNPSHINSALRGFHLQGTTRDQGLASAVTKQRLLVLLPPWWLSWQLRSCRRG